MAIKVPYSESEVGQVTEGIGGVKRQTCAFDGDSFLGSKGGAKASVDFIYLAPVLNQGVAVRDMCEVTKILRDSAVGAAEYAVHFSSFRDREKEVVRTKRVILAAGTMNTLRLLFASSAEPGGLRPMPSLGRTFGGNGDLFGAWFKNFAQPSMFESAPILGRFKVDGRTYHCRAGRHAASIRCRCRLAGNGSWRGRFLLSAWARTPERPRHDSTRAR
jgi:cholesterol oxidase